MSLTLLRHMELPRGEWATSTNAGNVLRYLTSDTLPTEGACLLCEGRIHRPHSSLPWVPGCRVSPRHASDTHTVRFYKMKIEEGSGPTERALGV